MEPEGYEFNYQPASEEAKEYLRQAFEAQAAQEAEKSNKSWAGDQNWRSKMWGTHTDGFGYRPDEKKTVTFYILQGGPHSGEKHLVDSKCKTLLVFDKSQTAHVYSLTNKAKFVHSLLPGEIKMKDTVTSWGKKDEYEPIIINVKDLNLE